MVKFAWPRLWAIVVKEFIQMKRDRTTFAFIIAIPLLQIILFGYAINSDPKHLPTAIVTNESSSWIRTFIHAMENTGYFSITQQASNESKAYRLLATGQVQFVLNIPPNFTRDLIRNNHPTLLLEADATDPAATSNAYNAFTFLTQNAFKPYSTGVLNYLAPPSPIIDARIHALYNPAAISQYNVVPGLIGTVLTMTMVMITAIAMTRERERGTLENLLATPVQPAEVIPGKVIPYIIVGYIQLLLILIIAHLLFAIPIIGSVFLLLITTLPFIGVNLAIGLLFSTAARNQLQAVQMGTFFFLPSILLSGFMFPFRGMPTWAQWLGELLPLTHYLRITRGILLKGNGIVEIWPDLWPLLLLLLIIILLGIKQFHRTLD